jgi:predicted nucleic acid-binding protein
LNDIYYLDASAWLKRYLSEGGSVEVRRIFQSGVVLAGTILGYVEVAAAITRRNRTDALRESLDRDWANMLRVQLSQSILNQAGVIVWASKLKGADVIHSGSAMHLRDQHNGQTTMVTADRELVTAARALGLRVLDPQAAPSIH